MDSYKVFYAVHRIGNQLDLYYKDLGVFACCMRQNDQPKLINTRQLCQGHVWQNCLLNPLVLIALLRLELFVWAFI